MWKEFMRDEGLKAMNISLLREHVSEFTQKHKPIGPTTKPGSGNEKRMVAVLEEGLEKKYPELFQRINEELS